jgi:itaconate CoA-transferase
VKVGISVADIAAGMYALSGILAALYRRERTGRGALLEVSLLESLAEWMGYPLYYTAYGGHPPARTGAHHATIAPYGPFPTADGVVFLAVQNDREWERFCREVLQRPELARDPRFATNPDRVRHRPALEALIRETFRGLSTAQLTQRLEAADVAYGELRTVQGLLEHPQLAARDRWRRVDSPVGPLLALLPPFSVPAEEPLLGPVPRLGEHTESVLREIGMEPEEVRP